MRGASRFRVEQMDERWAQVFGSCIGRQRQCGESWRAQFMAQLPVGVFYTWWFITTISSNLSLHISLSPARGSPGCVFACVVEQPLDRGHAHLKKWEKKEH